MLSIRKGVVAAALVGIALVVRGGFLPDGYLIHVRGIPNPPFPLEMVIAFSLLVIGECVVLLALLTWPRRFDAMWRTLLALLVFGAWTCLLILGGMHSPPYYFSHMIWSLLVSGALFLSFVAI